MADVLRLEDWMTRLPKRETGLPCEAKILLFTGVRYERWTDEEHSDHHFDKGPVKRSGSAKRKKH